MARPPVRIEKLTEARASARVRCVIAAGGYRGSLADAHREQSGVPRPWTPPVWKDLVAKCRAPAKVRLPQAGSVPDGHTHFGSSLSRPPKSKEPRELTEGHKRAIRAVLGPACEAVESLRFAALDRLLRKYPNAVGANPERRAKADAERRARRMRTVATAGRQFLRSMKRYQRAGATGLLRSLEKLTGSDRLLLEVERLRAQRLGLSDSIRRCAQVWTLYGDVRNRAQQQVDVEAGKAAAEGVKRLVTTAAALTRLPGPGRGRIQEHHRLMLAEGVAQVLDTEGVRLAKSELGDYASVLRIVLPVAGWTAPEPLRPLLVKALEFHASRPKQ